MALKIITCPWCGEEARITYEENRLYQMKCYRCHNTMLHEDRSFDRAVEFFEHHANLLQAEKDGRLVVLPAKTVFELAWDAGPNCDSICPVSIDDKGLCNFCDHGELFVHERPCRQEHIEQIGKTVFLTREEAEAALEGGKDHA